MGHWLVTGGAGYIGAHVVRELVASGRDVVVLDDLSSGTRERVPVPLVVTDVRDCDRVRQALREYEVEGVVHLAAEKLVDDSVRRPLHYYARNVDGLMSVLSAMQDEGVRRLVFSSSAAVYGNTQQDLVSEDDPTVPMNPYGETKLVGEWLIADQARADGLRYANLRYFNVAGAGAPELADPTDHNLISRVLTAIADGRNPVVFGADYPTPDGTCIRDFIHVEDLAHAHVVAVEMLDAEGAAHTLNVGSGLGFSVRDVIDAAGIASGRPVHSDIAARRVGDPARVVADTTRILAGTSWRPQRSLQDILGSAWEGRLARRT